jgi:hypothetical protein
MALSSSSVTENSGGSQQLLDGGLPSLSVSLSIQPGSLEQRYWWVLFRTAFFVCIKLTL